MFTYDFANFWNILLLTRWFLFYVSRLPLYMINHDEEYLSEENFEEVYVSSVTNPSLFFVQRAEQSEM